MYMYIYIHILSFNLQMQSPRSGFLSGPDAAGGPGFSVLPQQHEETEKLVIPKPDPKPKTVAALARQKKKEIDTKRTECQNLVKSVKSSERLSPGSLVLCDL